MWFTASLLFKSVHPDELPSDTLWEERVVLLQAPDETTATRTAEELGRAEEHEYVAATGQLVRWEFVQCERIYAIPSEALGHGTELFSRFLRTREVESLLTPFED